jgi:hypothetical protein
MKMRLVRIKYKTKKGQIVECSAISDYKGYRPIFIEEGYLDVDIISEEEIK